MSPIKAKLIIDALADGIDPETGEILPCESVFNNPSVIRALFVATKALNSAAQRAARTESLPSNAGRPWTENEDRELLSLFDSNVLVKDMAQKHGRTQGAIASRLLRLGRVKDRAEVR